MREGEILKKAFEQAEKFGYKWNGQYESFDPKDGTFIIHDNAFKTLPIEVFLFDPEFAKTFFGKEEMGTVGGIPPVVESIPNWKLQLKKLVVLETREERIKFLEEFLK